MPQRHAVIPLARPWMDEQEAEAARRVILSGWVTQGPEVAAFEREFAEFVGAEHACAVSSCSTALHLALLAIGTRPGDEIITVSHTFIATVSAIRQCGALPVLVDIDPRTYNMTAEHVAAAITPRTRGIVVVHQMGMPCDVPAICEVARQQDLAVIEDAACAAGSELVGSRLRQRIGQPHGDIACFSFHPRKLLTTGDGGMLTTRDARWDRQFRLKRQHGMSVPDTVRHAAGRVIFEDYPEPGFNYRMTDIQAAVGRVQLQRLPPMVERRRRLAEIYRDELADCPDIGLPHEPEWARSNWQSFCVRLPDDCDQRAVMQRLLESGVSTRRGIMCCHREGAHADLPLRHSLRESERAQDHCILVPLYPHMTPNEQDRVITALQDACRQLPCKV